MGKSIFLEGPFGVGKTTYALSHLSELGEKSERTIVLVPQRNLGAAYLHEINNAGYNNVDVFTCAGLARKVIDLFWPLLSREFGFGRKNNLPNFLTHETAQYYMSQVVQPMMDEGMFESIKIRRNRIYSQLLDNLNKSALNGFRHTDISSKLLLASVGDPEQRQVFQDAQLAANKYREFCLEHNLVDFSLQIELFGKLMNGKIGLVTDYLFSSFNNLIYDNCEEDAVIAHQLAREWIPHMSSSLIIYDTDSGLREFLGAEPNSAYSLKDICQESILFTESHTSSETMILATELFGNTIANRKKPKGSKENQEALSSSIEIIDEQYFPAMIDTVARKIETLIRVNNVSPSEIVVLAPFLTDSLRFTLSSRLGSKGIEWQSHRPSRSLIDESITRAVIALACLAHPNWGFKLLIDDIVNMLTIAVGELDLVRAQLLAEEVFQNKQNFSELKSFNGLDSSIQERITIRLGRRFEALRQWIYDYRNGPKVELDFFISKMFGEVLSQEGFGFHRNIEAGRLVANLVESANKFRQVIEKFDEADEVGLEYIKTVKENIIRAQYYNDLENKHPDTLLLSPAHTFLMMNYAVDYQFWLDIGNPSWHSRIYQPLTHPYVLRTNWPDDRYWTDEDEIQKSREHLQKVIIGLMRRCKKKIFLGLAQYGETGYENQGMLWENVNLIISNQRQSV